MAKQQVIKRNEAGQEIRQCPICGGWFAVEARRGKPEKYDSEDCRLTARRKQAGKARERAKARKAKKRKE